MIEDKGMEAQESAEMEAQEPTQETPEMEAQEPKLDPVMEKKVNAYVEGLSRLLHSKDTKAHVYGMLKAGDPMVTIPKTALAINDQMENQFKKKGQPVDVEVLVAGAQFLVSDLVEIGEAGGFFDIDQSSEDVMGTLMTNTMQPWIERKIKEDPNFAVELQAKVEPLMSEEARASALKYGQENGIDAEAGVNQAMQVSRRQGVLEGTRGAEKKSSVAMRQQQVRQGQPQAPQQGVLSQGGNA